MTPMLDDAAGFRRSMFVLLLVVAAGAMFGRIVNIGRVYEPFSFRSEDEVSDKALWPAKRPYPMPTLGSNDRSRWNTIRALVDDGTYVIGKRVTDPETGKYKDSGIKEEDGWTSVDIVLRPDTQEFLSSKPPLLPTVLAGEYWLLKHIFGWSITESRWLVVRFILVTTNWLPFLVYAWLLSRLIERFGHSEWGRMYAFAAVCFATFLTPFAVTLNNHSVATCFAVFALYPTLAILLDDKRFPWIFAIAGFFAGATACIDLPATSLAAGLFALLLWKDVRRTLLFFLPALLLPVGCHFLANYLATGRILPVYSEVGTGSPWYSYEGSLWKRVPGKPIPGIDGAWEKETRWDYALHFLIGHHGVYSLSPMFLFALPVMATGWRKRTTGEGEKPGGLPPMFVALTGYLTVTVLGFYLYRSNNYGGGTSGPRWLIWLSPFWILVMLPALDWLGNRKWGRIVAYGALAISVMSVSYPAWNPWRHPWLYNLFEALGWIQYGG